MDCVDCKSKKSNLCSKFPFQITPLMHRDDTSRFTTVEGKTLHHFLYVSSFFDYTVVDVVNVRKIDPEIPPHKACLFSCGVSTGVGSAWKTADVEPGSTVVIFGLGSIGLAVAKGARLCGANRIIGVDINSDKFEVGKQFGITEFVNSESCGDKPVSQDLKLCSSPRVFIQNIQQMGSEYFLSLQLNIFLFSFNSLPLLSFFYFLSLVVVISRIVADSNAHDPGGGYTRWLFKFLSFPPSPGTCLGNHMHKISSKCKIFFCMLRLHYDENVIVLGIDCSRSMELISELYIVKFLGEKKKRKLKGGL